MPNGELVREVEKEQLCGCCWCCVYGTSYYVEKVGVVLNKGTKLSKCEKQLQGEHTIVACRRSGCEQWELNEEKLKEHEFSLKTS